ncbi:MAG: hypothetical protein ACRC1K_07895 [Planctomycetia bacterium]
MPPPTVPLLTQARQSLWDAVDHWPPLAGRLKRRFRLEDAGALSGVEPTPSLGELPALAVAPAESPTPWATAQNQHLAYHLRFTLWTAHWDVRTAEELWEEIVRGLWRSEPPGGPEYWRSGGAANLEVGPFSPRTVFLAGGGRGGVGPVATRWDWLVVVSLRWNPRLTP